MKNRSKILIVEDNFKNRYLIRFMLEHAGYEIIEAETGDAGIERAITEHPDFILMDMLLPGITGYEATRILKENNETNDIPVIALTAYAMKGDKEKCIEAGCDEYLKKPINPETFVDEIREIFKRLKGDENVKDNGS